MEERRRDHEARTRYLRPIEHVTFTNQEMMSDVFSIISPSSVYSITQLHGERKGVIRITLKSRDDVTDLDTKLSSRKIHVNGMRLAEVKEAGLFLTVFLLDVPEYLSTTDIEEVLLVYGSVVNVKRDFFDYEGYQLDNEIRVVTFSGLDTELPQVLNIDGHEVFIFIKSMAGKSDGDRCRSRPSSPVPGILKDKPPQINQRRRSPSPVSNADADKSKVRLLSPKLPVRGHGDYIEVIGSPKGTLPRKLHGKAAEVVINPVEEVKRNLKPYIEKHQLRIQNDIPLIKTTVIAKQTLSAES